MNRRSDPTRLTVDVELARFGTLAAGSEVVVMKAGRGTSIICVDPADHHPGRCHAVRMPNSYLTPFPNHWRPNTRENR